jgi:hypothetical protein
MGVNLLTIFKPDHFINTGNIRCIAMKRSSLQKEQVNLQQKSFMRSNPGACIIKLITVVIYGFRNKLECLSLNIRLGWKGFPWANTVLFRKP